VWWQDEARIGQKNKITRRWARRGTRPSAPHDQRTKWAYIFGAICPQEGKAAGLRPALPLAPPLPSIASAAAEAALFGDFAGTMGGSDFP